MKSQSGGPAGLEARDDLPAARGSFRFWFGLGGGRRLWDAGGTARPAALAVAQLGRKPINSSRPLLPSGVPGYQPTGPEGLPARVALPARRGGEAGHRGVASTAPRSAAAAAPAEGVREKCALMIPGATRHGGHGHLDGVHLKNTRVWGALSPGHAGRPLVTPTVLFSATADSEYVS